MKLKVFICLAFLCFTTTKHLNAQVTIGSSLPPAQGALIDLKERDSGGTGGVTSSKGLMLPRVILTDLDNLYPMFSDQDASYKSNKSSIDKSHTGLIVYNMNKVQSDPCDFTVATIEEGIYSWSGEEWKNLIPSNKNNTNDDIINISVRNPNVKIFYDRRGGKEEPYTCRKFGTAGVWMTMNLRATSFSENSSDPSNITLKPFDNDPEFDKNLIKKKGAWYTTPYPSRNENGRPYRGFDDTWLKKNPIAGFLYNYKAIMGGLWGSLTNRQGICPDGWHVPTYAEFAKLRDAILSDPEEYLLKDKNGNYPSKENPKFSDALIVHCSPFEDESSTIIKGYAKSYSDGGFGAFSVSVVPIEYLWSTTFIKDSHSFPVNDGFKEEVHANGTSLGSDPTSDSFLKPRRILLDRASSGDVIIRERLIASAWTGMSFGYPMRCKKNDDNMNFD